MEKLTFPALALVLVLAAIAGAVQVFTPKEARAPTAVASTPNDRGHLEHRAEHRVDAALDARPARESAAPNRSLEETLAATGPSLETLVAEARDLDDAGLAARREELDRELASSKLIERANAGTLNQEEMVSLGVLLRRQNALGTVHLERALKADDDAAAEFAARQKRRSAPRTTTL
jgi:hypothetical protein